MLKLGVITDEVSQSLEEATEFAAHYGLDALELRSVDGLAPFEWSGDDARRFRRIADAHGLAIAAISAPLFKCRIDDAVETARHVAGFERCAQYCEALGCGIIRGFDFWDTGAPVEARAQAYTAIDAICRRYGITCAIEYDPSVHASTPRRIAELVRLIDSPRIRALYDPGNGIFSAPDERPYPDGYDTLKGMMCHVHVKDAVVSAGKPEAVRVGTGLVDYRGLMGALISDGYDGYVMLETHYRKGGALSEEQLKRPGGAKFSDGAYAASCESIESLLDIIKTASEGDKR